MDLNTLNRYLLVSFPGVCVSERPCPCWRYWTLVHGPCFGLKVKNWWFDNVKKLKFCNLPWLPNRPKVSWTFFMPSKMKTCFGKLISLINMNSDALYIIIFKGDSSNQFSGITWTITSLKDNSAEVERYNLLKVMVTHWMKRSPIELLLDRWKQINLFCLCQCLFYLMFLPCLSQ